MRSIDNLREYALTAASVNAMTRAVLAGYIDAIEREVEELRDRDYRNGREDAEGAVEFADRLKAAVDRREDVTLFGMDYLAYPLDADGVPWRIGDVIAWPDGSGLKSVIGIGKDCLFYVGSECEYKADWTVANDKHHAPTVEDVLREFGKRWDDPAHYAKGELVETFAEKLRLAGDE